MARAMKTGFVVCLRNEGADDLVVHKLYAVVADEDAAAQGFLRVIDDSGEDYLYPAELFAIVDLPEEIALQLLAHK